MIERKDIDRYLQSCGIWNSEDVESITFTSGHVLVVIIVKTTEGNYLVDERTGKPVTQGRRFDWDGKPWHQR